MARKPHKPPRKDRHAFFAAAGYACNKCGAIDLGWCLLYPDGTRVEIPTGSKMPPCAVLDK